MNGEISALIPSVRFLIDLTKQTFLNTSFTSPFFIALTIHPQKTALLLISLYFWYVTVENTLYYTYTPSYLPYLYPNPKPYHYTIPIHFTITPYYYILTHYTLAYPCTVLYLLAYHTILLHYIIPLHYTVTLYYSLLVNNIRSYIIVW